MEPGMFQLKHEEGNEKKEPYLEGRVIITSGLKSASFLALIMASKYSKDVNVVLDSSEKNL